MSEAIEGLKPELVWKYFAEISRIPRGSDNEAEISRYVMETAAKLGLDAKQDDVGNVAIKIPATPGMEAAPPVCIQGHLDMVCEANADKAHDFTKDPLELVRKDNMMMANGTTLGADNGIAVAAGLALMEDRNIPHGPLECLFTVAEETGLTGAKALQPGFIESGILLNLDSEEEGALYVGCSGGMDTVATWKLEYKDVPKKHAPMFLTVKGLKGGHSGLDIDKGRGNALKIINRAIMTLEPVGARLSMVNGGNKRNAVPREAEALLFVPIKRVDAVRDVIEQLNATIKAEFASVEPDLLIAIKRLDRIKKARVLRKSLQKQLCRALAGCPHGVVKMSPDIPGLVETSTNLASIRTDRKKASIATSQRSSVASELDEVCQSVIAVLELGGATVEQGDGYPGWKPNLESPILKVAQATYKSLFRKQAEIKAIHAGLECGIIGECYPGIDMISFGPTLEGVHSPDEKIYIDTVVKFWKLVLGILKNVK